MALVHMTELLRRAEEKGIGVGAFNCGNMEMIMGIIRAAEDKDTPIILQIAEGRLGHSPIDLIGPMMVSAAKNAKVDVAVHLDHGKSDEVFRKALDFGFTSVMIDGSSLPLEENIARTKDVIALAGEYGADVEAEIGVVGGNEGDGEHKVRYTDPLEAERFAEETKVDALAVAIGNAHGFYKGVPVLSHETLCEISERVKVPLVLHGGTGISWEDFRNVIREGIRKVNIATANLNACTMGARDYLIAAEHPDYFGMNEAMVSATYDNVARHIDVFNMTHRL